MLVQYTRAMNMPHYHTTGQENDFGGKLPAAQWERLIKYDVANNKFTGEKFTVRS